MGRVRKYKKVKAMDPFAKGGGGGRMGMGRKGGSDLDRNLPPDVKNHQAQRLNNLEGGVWRCGGVCMQSAAARSFVRV